MALPSGSLSYLESPLLVFGIRSYFLFWCNMDTPGVFPRFVNVIISSPRPHPPFFCHFVSVLMSLCFPPGWKWSMCVKVPCTRLLFPNLPSLSTLGALLPRYSEQTGTLTDAVLRMQSLVSLQQHSRALHKVIVYQFIVSSLNGVNCI